MARVDSVGCVMDDRLVLSILQKLLPAAFANKMFYMGGLIGEGLAEDRIGQAAGAKGLPEGFARVFGHHILAVIPWHQYHDMAGALATFVTAMDFTRRVLVVRVAHKGAREESGRPSYSSPLGSQSLLAGAVSRLTFCAPSLLLDLDSPLPARRNRVAQADSRFCGLLVSGDDMAGGVSSGCPANSG